MEFIKTYSSFKCSTAFMFQDSVTNILFISLLNVFHLNIKYFLQPERFGFQLINVWKYVLHNNMLTSIHYLSILFCRQNQYFPVGNICFGLLFHYIYDLCSLRAIIIWLQSVATGLVINLPIFKCSDSIICLRIFVLWVWSRLM